MQDIDLELFMREMRDVAPLKQEATAHSESPTHSDKLQPGLEARRQAAVEAEDPNFLLTGYVPWVDGGEQLKFRRDGVQNGVFRRLAQGRYDADAVLDLRRKSMQQARQELFNFILDATNSDYRNLLVVHGRGGQMDESAGRERSERRPSLKSYVAAWLPQFPEVLAFHSAQKQEGGAGSLYVMLKKTERSKQKNRSRHGFRPLS